MPWKCSCLCLYVAPGVLKSLRNTSERHLSKRAARWWVCDFYLLDVRPPFNLWMSQICPIYPAHTAGQVSKFPSPHWVTWNTTNIDWGRESISSVDFNLQVSARLCFHEAPCRRTVRLPAAVFFLCVCVCEGMCVWVHRPGNMRRLLLLLLGLLLLHQGRCFEFVIDGEWEDEPVSWRVPNSEKHCYVTFYLQMRP